MAEDDRWALIDTATGSIVNIIIWNADSPYPLPPGCEAIPCPPEAVIGAGRRADGLLEPPPAPPLDEPDASLPTERT